MAAPSARAQAVAVVLYELKKAQKLATLTAVANRAGFSPGAGGRTISTCLQKVRRDWPHLEWWRAVADTGELQKEQESHLIEAGFETESVDGDGVVVKGFNEILMNWEEGSDDEEKSPEESSAE